MRDIYNRYGIDPEDPVVVEALKHIKMVKYKKGDTILPPYNPPQFIYIIDDGLVKVCTVNKKGEESINLIYKPGELFPMGWIIKQSRPDAFFVAMTDCEVGLLPKEVFLQMLNQDPKVTRIILDKVLELFVAYSARVTNLEYRYGRERVAYRLLMLAGRLGEKHEDYLYIPPISQQDLGATMNMTRESVNREIAYFEKHGYIEYARTGIKILDPKALQKELGKDETVLFYDASY